MKNKLQPTRTTFSRSFQCKKAPSWLRNFFHFGTEIGEEQLKKTPCTSYPQSPKEVHLGGPWGQRSLCLPSVRGQNRAQCFTQVWIRPRKGIKMLNHFQLLFNRVDHAPTLNVSKTVFQVWSWISCLKMWCLIFCAWNHVLQPAPEGPARWERWGCYWQTVPPQWGGIPDICHFFYTSKIFGE